jgi:hypothetical protein
MQDDDIYIIDESMSYTDIDNLGLSVRQLTMAYDNGMLSHLDETEIKGLGLAAAKRDAASLYRERVISTDQRAVAVSRVPDLGVAHPC